MIVVLIAGAAAGAGVLLFILVVAPPRTQPGSALARLDVRRTELRARAQTIAADPNRAPEAAWVRTLGRSASDVLARAGVELGQLRSDLAVVGRTLESHLATSVVGAVVGFFVPVVVATLAVLAGAPVSIAAPLGLSLLAAVVGAGLPSIVVRGQARTRRRDFRHVVGSFLDLVAMSLAGGRGVPEALQSASELSDSWGMVRIRNALGSARLHGRTPWSALGMLGEELRIDELRDLAAALALVAEDGAKVRDSLSARAGSLRRRELAESEGKAGESSQAMLVAQLLLCLGFLIFLLYPAVEAVFTGV
ncbi:type II secretion system F family protein [Cellulomonas sp. JH27-2]|uniref:type II secretion system F family protein n=1 Tax=Cellulomonas sp. JH27-2 TaxID=2774139 RepID=UPI00177F1293|nr:type II secretion system F family protein [Cellulomonas sp. JH27-2]MBD8058721.1 type II secretion system F family protein [Cellulomonas sp. JH27-2]